MNKRTRDEMARAWHEYVQSDYYHEPQLGEHFKNAYKLGYELAMKHAEELVQALGHIERPDECSIENGPDKIFLTDWRNTTKALAKQALSKWRERTGE